jgi:type IV secretory pathway component VirB8
MLPSGNDAALVLSFTIAHLMLLKKSDIYLYNRYVKGGVIDIEREIERSKKLLKHTFLD